MKFEWNDGKALQNARKHRVTFEEAITVFGDPLSITIPDPEHSEDEERFVDIGSSDNGRVLVVVYTERRGRIRIISGRKATVTERRLYEKKRS